MITYLAQITNPALSNSLGTDLEGSTAVTNLVSTSIRAITVFGAILSLFFMIKGSLGWINAEGKPDKLEIARTQIIYAVSGVIILFSVVAISTLIKNIYGIDFLNISIPNIE